MESLLTPELKSRIEEALDSIRPYLEADGGDVRVVDLDDDMILKLEFLGNCQNCRISNMTLKAGIEGAVKNSVPEVKSVEAINMPEFS